jgi:hypothetical protein
MPYLQGCCVCHVLVDTREISEGGDVHGAQLTNGAWVCSSGCWEVAAVQKDATDE